MFYDNVCLKGPWSRIVNPGPSFRYRMRQPWILWRHEHDVIVTWRHQWHH